MGFVYRYWAHKGPSPGVGFRWGWVRGGLGGDRTVWEKDKLKSPKMPNRSYRILAESLFTATLKRLESGGKKKINKDNQTRGCKWINIERREERLKEKDAEG